MADSEPIGADAGLWRWKLTALLALGVIVAVIPLAGMRQARRGPTLEEAQAPATFVGRQKCIACHKGAYDKWVGSHHDLAMAEATAETVLGDFNGATFEHQGIRSRFFRRAGRYFVHTEGPGGKMADFEVRYTFGVEPLQQYLVPLPGGRLQALSIAWDVVRKRWFHLYPDRRIPAKDWLHWTRGAQNWNGMCAKCHSTNLRKGYDPQTRQYQTEWSEIDVSCEACHGPASRHVAWAEIHPMARPEISNQGLVVATSAISARQQVELCAACHARRSELGDFGHGSVALLDQALPRLLDERFYHADGQILEEVYVYGSFVQSKMFQRGVACNDCHDVHSLKLHQPDNALCVRCHRGDAYDTREHHFHKKVHQGQPSAGARCVKCHMPEKPYMVIDYRADHSLRVPRPDLSLELGVPNACSQQGCHQDKPLRWAADAFAKWYGLARKPHFGRVLAAGRKGTPGTAASLIGLASNPLYPPIVRATALSLLQRFSGPAATAALEQALSDDEALVRHTALMTIDVGTVRQHVSRVAPLLFDPVQAVRMQAASKLAGAPPESLEPYQRRAFDKALGAYERAMRYSLDFAFGGMNLGNLYTNLGRQAEAEAAYRMAIEVDDLFYPAKVNLATLLSAQGKSAEAEKLLQQVVRAYPEQYQAAYSLGLLLAELKRDAEAARLLEQASKGMPGHARAHYNLGLLKQRMGDDAGAEAALQRALTTEPANPQYIFALADHYIRRRMLEQALPLAEKMIAVAPDNPIGQRLKALITRGLRSGRK